MAVESLVAETLLVLAVEGVTEEVVARIGRDTAPAPRRPSEHCHRHRGAAIFPSA
jgi:hypothetical protein